MLLPDTRVTPLTCSKSHHGPVNEAPLPFAETNLPRTHRIRIPRPDGDATDDHLRAVDDPTGAGRRVLRTVRCRSHKASRQWSVRAAKPRDAPADKPLGDVEVAPVIGRDAMWAVEQPRLEPVGPNEQLALSG